MGPLDVVKDRLRRYFISSRVSPDDAPMRIFQEKDKIYYQYKNKKIEKVYLAESDNGFDFQIKNKTLNKKQIFDQEFVNAKQVPTQDKYIYFGDRKIQIAVKDSQEKFTTLKKPLIQMAKPIELISIFERNDGNLVLYYSSEIIDGIVHYEAYLALANKSHPDEIIWEMNEPIWKQSNHWEGKSVFPLGAVLIDKKIITYFFVDKKLIYGVVNSGFDYDPNKIKKYQLDKHVANPIVSPNQENDWEAFTTLNPAAFQAGGKVHILYRAQGFDYVSTVGYASSKDGVSIDRRSEKPIYAPHEGFEINKSSGASYDFMSGGGYGGCEDPRVTQIGDRLYMTYVAFDGWSPPRLALTSIHIDDFLQERWNWEKPVLISQPGVVDKSGCILPEKIDGKYVIFHRIFPNILIDFVDDLNFDGETNFLKGEYSIKIREDKWDSRKIGAGAPPLKTKDGWLLIYYGVDDKDDSKYLVGAMLLDLKDPTKVLHRTDYPIIEPVEYYENIGFKPGIVYPCGAVILNGKLMVYYGGADSNVCVAESMLDDFLEKLKDNKVPKLTPVTIKEINF